MPVQQYFDFCRVIAENVEDEEYGEERPLNHVWTRPKVASNIVHRESSNEHRVSIGSAGNSHTVRTT
ncbi:MAG: hypothetical protein QGG53_03540 [Planctomycetota bacterium]|jgi:hypothetical protein|nr:hypothetical protein [Planctomycetota bacterium]